MFSKLTDKLLAPHRKEDHIATTEVPIQTTTTTSINNNTNTIITPTLTPIATSTTTTTTVLPTTTTTSIDATTTQMSNVSIEEAIAQGTIVRETIVKPAIVEETVRKDTVVEVQPIVHREIEQPIINHIDQHVLEPKAAFVGGTVTNQPIIQEHVSTRVIEEVQPIVHREIAVAKVQKVEEHLQERVVAPTQHTHDKTQITGLASDLTHQKDAIVKTAIVEETIRNDKIIEVQPVIHRDIERTIVRHIEEHIVEPAAPFVGGRVENAAIVEEHVTARAVDEIQPIVHREVAVPKVEKVEEHLQERVVAPTQHTNAVMEKAGMASSITHDSAAIVKPAIIDEKVREDIIVEVQPVVHREIDQKIVNHVEAHVVEPAAPFVGGTVQNKPIIDEKINTKVIDEVQPVLHREVAVPVIEKKEVHVAEHVIAPTQHTRDEKTISGHVTDIHASKSAIIKPAIVDEKIRTDTVVEVQPIVHREIDQKVVNHVEEHIVEPRAANVGGKVVNAPKVEERVVTEVVQEVQPVVHREIAVPVVEKVEQHVSERVVAPTQHTSEKIEVVEKREEVFIDPASLSNFEKNKLLKKESKHTAAM